MKKVIILASVFFGINTMAQIELKESNFATKGALERMSSAAANSTVDLNTGAGYFWDFSNLTPQSQTIEEYKPISQLGAIANFQFGNTAPTKYKATYFILNPDLPLQNLPSFLPIQFSDYNSVMRLSADSLSLVGVTISINGQTLPIRYSDIEAQFYFPVKYLDHYTTRGKFDQDLNPIYDAKWRQKRQHEINVDGWGKAFTPIGSFDVLRVKHTIIEQDSIYATVSGFGMWVPINVPKQNIYEWRTTTEKSPIVRIKTTITGSNETIRSIEYRDNTEFVGVSELNNDLAFSIYPNPVFNVLKMNTSVDFQKYEIISIDGKLVQSGIFSPEIDCSNLKAGSYLLRLTANNSVKTKSFVKE